MRKIKRSLALLMVIVMLGSSIAMAIPASAATVNISSPSELAGMSNNGSYKLTADITVSASIASKLTGITFDGDGHTITLASSMQSGLFAELENSIVKNLTVKAENDATLTFAVKTSAGTSPIVAKATSCTFENVTNTASVTTTAATAWFGGIAGNVFGTGKFTNCTNKGNFIATNGEYLGGIVGVNNCAAIDYTGCENYGNLTGLKGSNNRNDVGGIIGYIYKSGNNLSSVKLNDCISMCVITAEAGDVKAGGIAGRVDVAGHIKEANNCYNFTNKGTFGDATVKEPTNTSEVKITKADQLKSLTAGGIYAIDADFEAEGGYTLPDGATINGKGHTITLKGANSLFKTASGTAIANLNIAGTINATAAGTGAIGALIGSASGMINITNITSTAAIKVSGTGYSAVGGIIGSYTAGTATTITLLNAENKGDINVTARVESIGGIVGALNNAGTSVSVGDVKNNGGITASDADNIGGIIGMISGNAAPAANIEVADNYGNITANTNGSGFVGGIVGTAASNISISAGNNHAVLTGKSTGGILGKAASAAVAVTLIDCNNFGGCISANSPSIIGICGKNELATALVITDCKDYAFDISIKAVDVALGNELAMRYYIGKAIFTGAESINATAGDYTVEMLEETAFINGLECRIFCIWGISPADMGDAIDFKVTVKKNGETVSASKTYSIKDYCFAQFRDKSVSRNVHKLCVDLLYMGAEAQKKVGDTGPLVTEELRKAQNDLATIKVPAVTNKNTYEGTANTAVAEWDSVTVSFEKTFVPTFKFKAQGGVEGMKAKIICGKNGLITIDKFTSAGEGVYTFALEGLSIADLRSELKLTLENATGVSQTLVFSVDAYAAEMIADKKDKELAEAVLKYMSCIDLYLLDVVTYDIKKYTAPIWEGNIVYAEPAFIRETSKTDSSVAPITLLYPIDEIISVRSSDMKTLYEEGVDYVVEDGKLIIKTAAQGGSIKILPYYSADTSVEAWTYSAKGTYNSDSTKKGDIYYYYNDPMYGIKDPEGGIVKWNISVTYRHSGESIVSTPTDQSEKFEGLMDKLVAGNELKVVSLGDSITEGCSASANHAAYGGVGGTGWGPAAPAYNQMFCDYLEAAYGVEVTHKNYAIGGTQAVQALNATGKYENNAPIPKVIADKPDIFILAYGMNDGGYSTSDESTYMKAIVDKVLKDCPDAYVIVVSTCLLGQQYSTSNGNRRYFGEAFENTFKGYENVVVANVTKADIEMQGYDVAGEKNHTGPKVYQDLTGSNSNHPNDFIHRIYTQVMIQSAFGENKFAG